MIGLEVGEARVFVGPGCTDGDCCTTWFEEFRKRQASLEKKISQALERCQSADTPEGKQSWEKKTQRYKQNHEKIQQFLTNATKIQTKKGKEIRQNITDRDCRIMKVKAAPTTQFASANNSPWGEQD